MADPSDDAFADLQHDIQATRCPPGTCAFWWLGQHGFAVKLGTEILWVDPYLTPSPARRFPPAVVPGEVRVGRLVLGSHDHGDHIDRKAWPDIAAANPEIRFLVPELVRQGLAADLDIPESRFLGLDDGQSVAFDGIRITGIAAAHEFLDTDPCTGRSPYLGFVIEGNGVVLYHSGDTCRYEGLLGKLKSFTLDVAFLPINGRDAKRLAGGCIGNMTYQEAVDLAGELRPGLTVPTHFDMFAGNSEDPERFRAYFELKYPALKTLVPVHGQRVVAGPGVV